MNTNEVTNLKLTLTVNGERKFTERYILPNFREELLRLMKEATDNGEEDNVFVVTGSDGIWWNDDLDWLLDRMVNGMLWTEELSEFRDMLEFSTFSVGEKKVYTEDDITIEAVGDNTDVSKGKIEQIG